MRAQCCAACLESLTSAQEGGIFDACPSLRTTHGDAEKPSRSFERGSRRRRAGRKLVHPVVHAVFCRRQHRFSDHEDSWRRQRLADRRRLAEGWRPLPRADQGQRQAWRIRRRRVLLHGPQQPEPPQLPVPRLPHAVGGLHRREDQVDRSRAGRLQRPPAAIDRDWHRRFRHHRDGRAVRRRHGREGPAVRHAGLGEDADRFRRLRQLPQAAGRHVERKDPPRSPSTATATR